jgi:hypothetical protein
MTLSLSLTGLLRIWLLAEGTTIYCARITCYVKDGNPMSVGLGLRRLEPDTTVHAPEHPGPEDQVLVEYYRVRLITGTGWGFEGLFGGKPSTVVVC